jgi:hypothetical protein
MDSCTKFQEDEMSVVEECSESVMRLILNAYKDTDGLKADVLPSDYPSPIPELQLCLLKTKVENKENPQKERRKFSFKSFAKLAQTLFLLRQLGSGNYRKQLANEYKVLEAKAKQLGIPLNYTLNEKKSEDSNANTEVPGKSTDEQPTSSPDPVQPLIIF